MQFRQTNFYLALDWLMSEPRNFVLVLVAVLMLVVSLPGAVICTLIGWGNSRVKIPAGWIFAIGCALVLAEWYCCHVSLISLWHINFHELKMMFNGKYFGFFKPLWWMVSFPLAVMVSGFLIHLMRNDSSLSDEVKRLARGEHVVKNYLDEHQIRHALAKIPSAAIPDGACLGVDRVTGEPVYLIDDDANLYTLAIGTTGSGKTTGIANIIESAILRKHPVIVVDGKGDLTLARRVKEYAEKNQRPCYVFSMIGESVKYNPLSSGGITSRKDRIIALRNWSEEHYKKIAEGYLQTVFFILDRCGVKTDLCQVAQYLEPQRLGQLAHPLKDESLMAAIRDLNEKRPNIESLRAEIENLANSEIGNLFDCQQGQILKLEKALQENAVVYFCLQPLAFPSYAECLGKLIINDIKHLASSQLASNAKSKIFTIFDEFSVFAGDQIINLINQGRSAGIHAILSTQSLSDIEKVGGQPLVGQVVNNCNNYIIHRQNNPVDAEMLAKIIGTFDEFEVTAQLSVDQISGLTGSAKSIKQFLVHPDEIKRFKIGEAIIMIKKSNLINFVNIRLNKLN